MEYDTDFSDSDDDILGISNNPIIIKTSTFRDNKHKYLPSKYHQNIPDKRFTIFSSPPSGEKRCLINDKRSEASPIGKGETLLDKSSLDPSDELSKSNNNQGSNPGVNSIEIKKINPSTEYTPKKDFIIRNLSKHPKISYTNKESNSSSSNRDAIKLYSTIDTNPLLSNETKHNKYQRLREIYNIEGFIVNVHDATNFDIDLNIKQELHEIYQNVISNQYTYQDLDETFLENPDFNQIKQKAPKIGTAYRCRLRGVGINQLSSTDHTWISNKMCMEIKQLIDRTDGWIECTLSDIDVYQRLLVDVVVHTYNGDINLRDHLLSLMENENDPIFYPYSCRRDNIRNQRYNSNNSTEDIPV